MVKISFPLFLWVAGQARAGNLQGCPSVSQWNQDEIDRLWSSLSDGGKEVQCGWLVDKFGVSWQIVPANIGELMSHPDPAKAGRVMQVLFR